MSSPAADRELVQRIRQHDESAWRACIVEYEGRLQAFAVSRLGDALLAEDLVQETFLGFLIALPNYDETTPLESFLFAIAAHKIIDALRRQGRRPTLRLSGTDSEGEDSESAVPGRSRMASSLARSRERRDQEEHAIANCLRNLIQQWHSQQDYERLKCAELLFSQGRANKEVASFLGISEQAVANHKQYVMLKLKAAAQGASDFGLPQ